MGSSKSKFYSPKNNNIQKKYITKLQRIGLRYEEADHVFKLLGEQKFVSRTVVRELWHNFLTAKLMQIYEDYLVEKSEKKHGQDNIDVIAFNLFLTNFIKGTIEDRTEIYFCFLQKDNVVLISDLQEVFVILQYLIELMKSVLLLMDIKKVIQYIQWSEKGNTFPKNDIRRWASATISNIYDLNKINSISHDEMMSWMTLNNDVILLQCFLFCALYDLDKLESNQNVEHKSIHCPLPYLEPNILKEDWNVIINIPSVIFVNSHLPVENRYRWRLVYSTDSNGEGFTTFRSLICNNGPTVLVVKDKDDHIFGGYASTSWHVGPKFFGDQRCFLFSLKPVMRIYPTLSYNDHFLYLNANQKVLPNGLGMGGQFDYWGLWIDASFEFGSCSPSCSTYAGYHMLSGSPVFRITGLEVWCAEGMYNLSDENESTVNSVTDYLKKDQETSSILLKDPGARALMDMLGKSGNGREFLNNTSH